MQRRHRGRQGEAAGQESCLDHRQDDRSRAVLEVDRGLGAVGVADDDVQTAILLGVRMWFVAGVDDRPLERRLETDADLEVVGALADLEGMDAAVLLLTDPAGAGEHLA